MVDINGTLGNDNLPGNPNPNGLNTDDTINAFAGNDRLIGGLGDDTLLGGSGNDGLVGVNSSVANPGQGEIDFLTGGADADRFFLGNVNNVYYDDGNSSTSGTGDFGWITDFTIEDRIYLHGEASDYTLGSWSMIGPDGLVSGTGILLIDSNGSNELIGFVEGIFGLDLNSSNQFVYV
ncbi:MULTISPECIES: calcium-binding protein [Moorena]|uniref:calcium-binding protein n=1 Tax=Moorena TaxID=1155738 RepID=UPI00142C6FD5|nr:hypothetical protein [Moorena sp. SIO4G3]NEO80023.1 hypothetical protein [Moorena sp. SIO4G3]